jgi:hypothetical protein
VAGPRRARLPDRGPPAQRPGSLTTARVSRATRRGPPPRSRAGHGARGGHAFMWGACLGFLLPSKRAQLLR